MNNTLKKILIPLKSLFNHESKSFLKTLTSDSNWKHVFDTSDDLKWNTKPGEVNNPIFNILVRECTENIIEPLEGKTTGKIPDWIKGSLLLNGPGNFTFGENKAQHLFDGSAIIQSFDINNSHVTYRCRFLNTETLRRNTKAKNFVCGEFGTPLAPDPCKTIFQNFQSRFMSPATDNCNVSIYPLGSELYAFTETTKMHNLNIESLTSKKMVNIKGGLELFGQTAHPHSTPDGLLYNVGIRRENNNLYYTIFKIPKEINDGIPAKVEIEANLTTSEKWYPSYMHSFGLSDNFFTIVEQPLALAVKRFFLNNLLKKPYTHSLTWKDDLAKLRVVNRHTGKQTEYVADTFFFFHMINQYEEDGHIIFDLCLYKDPRIINSTFIKYLKDMPAHPNGIDLINAEARRFVIPLETEGKGNLVKLKGSKATAERRDDGKIYLKSELLSSVNCELPRINYPALMGKKYRYFYAISNHDLSDGSGKVVKVDTELKTCQEWYEKGTVTGEAIFLPSAQGKTDEDGVLLFSLYWIEDKNKTALVVLDAKTMTELGRTVFNTHSPVPKHIHGWYKE